MKKLVIIDGPKAVGKSTIYNILTKTLKDFCFVSPSVFSNSFKIVETIERRKLKKKISFILIEDLIHLNQNILVEAISPSSVIKRFHGNSNASYIIISIYLVCSINEAIRRDIEREKLTMTEDVIKSHLNFLPYENYEITINTEKYTIEEIIKIIIDYINNV